MRKIIPYAFISICMLIFSALILLNLPNSLVVLVSEVRISIGDGSIDTTIEIFFCCNTKYLFFFILNIIFQYIQFVCVCEQLLAVYHISLQKKNFDPYLIILLPSQRFDVSVEYFEGSIQISINVCKKLQRCILHSIMQCISFIIMINMYSAHWQCVH